MLQAIKVELLKPKMLIILMPMEQVHQQMIQVKRQRLNML